MRHATAIRAIAVALAAATLAGCLSEAELRQRRIEQNYTVYAQLAPDAQQRVSVGTFAVGDPQSAVWLAWGDPDARSYGANAAGTFEIWQYTRTVAEPYEVLVYDPPPPPPPGPYAPPPPPPMAHYETKYRYISVPARQVDFANGVVSQIQVF